MRAEVLAAARDLLAETGAESAVSVRAIADRVGVTPPSIYLHFPDKDALLDAVCDEVFEALDAAMERAAATAHTAFAALRERGLAYVRFALANPEHYRLVLMRRRELDRGPSDLAGLSSSGAFAHLLDSVRRCQNERVFSPDDDPEQLALALWSAAHGVAALGIAYPWLVEDDGEELVTSVIDAIGLGLALRGRQGTTGPLTLLAELDDRPRGR